MRVISYFTGESSYVKLADRLKSSCDKFGINHHIEKMQVGGDWMAVCNRKPHFILTCLLTFRSPVVWLDVDCEVLKLPTIFWRDAHDFAIYNWAADPQNTEHFPQYCEHPATSSGVVMFRYTAPAIELLLRWVDACAENPKVIDDQVLDAVWRKSRPPVNVMWLPRTANWLTGRFGPPTTDVMIRHDYVGGNEAQGHWKSEK